MQTRKVSYRDAISYRARRVTGYLLLCLIITLAGCQSPMLIFPGGELKGEEKTTDSFAFASEYATLELEVNPAAPYSVILRTSVIDGELYIDAASARRWGKHLSQDQQVRIRLGNTIYPATAVRVTDPDITGEFLAGRTVYRIVPADTGGDTSVRSPATQE